MSKWLAFSFAFVGFIHFSNAGCFEVEGLVRSSSKDKLEVVEKGRIHTFRFSGDHLLLPTGVLVTVRAFSEKNQVVTNMNSIDIPQRNVASSKQSFRVVKGAPTKEKCLR